jgi:hypothetical protein
VSDFEAFSLRLEELGLRPGVIVRDDHRPVSDYPRFPAGLCYLASRTLAECYPELTVVYGRLTWWQGGVYCELDHAWCTTPNGRVVDSTWSPPREAGGINYWPNEVTS